MIDNETAPEMISAAKNIGERLARVIAGQRYDAALARQIRQQLYDHRTRFRREGVDFPPMTVLAVPRIGAIALYRADLEPEGIRGAALQFIRLHPDVTREEAAMALRWAWPHIRPGDLVDEGVAIVAADQARVKANEAAESTIE